MSDYKQFRADFAKLAWVAALTTTHDSKTAAQKAVSWADDFIAELERTEAQDRMHGILATPPHMEPELFQAARAEMPREIGIVQPEPTAPATRPLPPVLAQDEKEEQP